MIVPLPLTQTNNLGSSETKGREVICVYRDTEESAVELYSN